MKSIKKSAAASGNSAPAAERGRMLAVQAEREIERLLAEGGKAGA